MRITILSLYQQLVERGVEVYVDSLLKHLGNKCNISAVSAKKEQVLTYSGQEILPLRRLYLDSVSLNTKRLTQKILTRLEKNPPDILYPVNNGWQSILCKNFSKKHQTKFVLAGHSGPGWDDQINLWLKPDAFITFSQTQKNWAKKHGGEVTVEKIPHAVDTQKFIPKTSTLNLGLEKPIFAVVSALSPQTRGGETAKNVDLSIRAIASLKKGSLLLLGQGPDQTRIDKLAKSILGTRYRRFSVSHNIIQQYYQVADVFTLASSKSEAFGISYLEALACNLPIVTLNDSLRKEIIGPAGIFVDHPENVEEYSRALNQAASRNWKNLPQTQAKKYSWEKTTKQYINLFASLTRNKIK